MCYVAGWDKNQGQFQNNSWLLLKGYFRSSPLLPVPFDDVTSIMNFTVNKDNQRTSLCTFPHTYACLLYFYFFQSELALKCIPYLWHKLVLHISIRFCIHVPFEKHGNCFLLLHFWVWMDYAMQLQMIADHNWVGEPKLACVNTWEKKSFTL